MYDEGKEFTGSPFQDGLEMHGIQPVEINRQAPFELGTVERRGGMFKTAYYRTRELRQPQTIEEVEELIFEVSWAIQTLTNRSGYSPAQRVFGKQPTLSLDCLSDGREYHLSASSDAAWQAANHTRQCARRALIELDSKTRLRRARLGRPRQELQSLQFEEGEPVMVWRSGKRGTAAKVGPCWVILQRGHTVWISRRGEIWKCNVGQVFKMSEADRAGLESIPTELLKAKTRLKYDTEMLLYVDAASEIEVVPEAPSGGSRKPGCAAERNASEQHPEPTEVPVPDPPGDPDDHLSDYSPDLDDASEQHPEPAEVPVPDPVVTSNDVSSRSGGGSSGDMTSLVTSGSTSSSSSSASSPSSATPPRPAEWPPTGDGTQLRKWVRYDSGARRFRMSNSMGPMWGDVVQRVTIDNGTGEIIRRETITGREKPKDLCKPLPERVKSVKTVLVYKRVRGRPDPGVENAK